MQARRHISIAFVLAGALLFAGCGSKPVPDVVGMNPQEAIEAMHAAELNTNSHGGLGLEEGTGFVVCETNPKAGETTRGEVEIYSHRDCKPKTATAKADVARATSKARDRDGDGDHDDEVLAQQASKPARSTTAGSTRARSARAGGTAGSGCTRQTRAVVVSLSKYPNIADHVRDAIAAGQPVILHIDRKNADEHRAESTDDLPTKRGYDRDEYPPAMSREGGESADVRHVKSSENRAAGATMGGQLRGYCNGQAFRLKVGRTPKPAEHKPIATATPTAPDAGVDQTSSDESVFYANCAAARAAGAAPVTAGDPGYASHLDRDGDGVACES